MYQCHTFRLYILQYAWLVILPADKGHRMGAWKVGEDYHREKEGSLFKQHLLFGLHVCVSVNELTSYRPRTGKMNYRLQILPFHPSCYSFQSGVIFCYNQPVHTRSRISFLHANILLAMGNICENRLRHSNLFTYFDVPIAC